MRVLWLLFLSTGCAYISDKHEAWRLDPDEDGASIVDDCDDNDGSIGAPIAWYADKDEDGFGDTDDAIYRCEQPDGRVEQSGDCRDTEATVYPGANELCDGMDNNCDGTVDEGLTLSQWFVDEDGDGFGNPEDPQEACGELEGLVNNGDDCDDSDPTWHSEGPGEIPYNGIDDNCNALDGDGDFDLDGYWASDYHERVTDAGGTPMDVHPDISGDCDDTDETIRPGAFENWYDGVDSDCDGRNDCDQDGDGYEAAEGICEPDEPDCNDLVDDVNPGAVEVCDTADEDDPDVDYIEVDEDCDGSTQAEDAPGCTVFYADFDSDGWGVDDSICRCRPEFPHTALTSGDCNDGDGTVHPGAFDAPYDGVDRDCGGEDDYDFDGDGYANAALASEYTGELPATDCDDGDPAVNPSATEVCDGIDNDCDDATDEDDSADAFTWYLDTDGDGYGHETFEEVCEEIAGDCDTGGADTAAADTGGCAYEEVCVDVSTATQACEEPEGYAEDSTDCDDSDATMHPGAMDYCGDDLDSDCSGDSDGCIDVEPKDIIDSVSCLGEGALAPEYDFILGDHLLISHGEPGNWLNDTLGSGLAIRPGDAAGDYSETIYSGAKWDFLVVQAPPYEPYEIGHTMELDAPPILLCSKAVRVGDVIGSVRTIEFDMIDAGDGGPVTVELTLKELLNENGESVLLEYTLSPEPGTGALDFTLQRFVDFDIDSLPAPDDLDVSTTFTTDGSVVVSSGPITGESVALGSCNSNGLVGSEPGRDLDAGGIFDGVCDPDGYSADAVTVLHAVMSGASFDSPGSHRFVLSTGMSSTEAIDEWNNEAELFCGDAWEPDSLMVYPEDSCEDDGSAEEDDEPASE